MDVCLMLKLLGQMLQPFQPHQFSQEPLLEGLFRSQESIPRPLDVGDHLSLGGDISRSIGQTELGLQCVEVGLQFCLLLNARRLMFAAIFAVLFQFLLHGHQGVARLATFQPGQCAADPFQKLNIYADFYHLFVPYVRYNLILII